MRDFPLQQLVKPKQWAKIVLIGVMFATVSGRVSAALPCEALVEQAYKRLNDVCGTIGRNQACYGNDAIRTQFNTNIINPIFQKSGDMIPVSAIRELYTLPMDEQAQTWGLSLMKVQTNLPDTAPGQNVVFVLHGDVHLSNVDNTGRMAAFYFTSGLGQPMCKAAPANGMMVRSPKGTRVQFTANGVNIDIGSTVMLQAWPNAQLTIQLLEGSAIVKANGGTQALTPGQALNVALGGADGMQAIGTPSAPVSAPENPAQAAFLEKAAVAFTTASITSKTVAPPTGVNTGGTDPVPNNNVPNAGTANTGAAGTKSTPPPTIVFKTALPTLIASPTKTNTDDDDKHKKEEEEKAKKAKDELEKREKEEKDKNKGKS